MSKALRVALPVLFIVAFAIVVMTINDASRSSAANEGKYCTADGQLSNQQTIQSHRSYCVKSHVHDVSFKPNTPSSYSFTIVDDRGEVVKDFAITHTKSMHVIVVREDLQYFQHVHPDFDEASGTFTIPELSFPESGTYRIFADFAPQSAMMDSSGMPLGVTLFEDVKVGGRYSPQSLGSEERTKTFGNQQAVLTTSEPLQAGTTAVLSFQLTEDGKPVTDLEEYLGALGHSVILREDTLDFIHAHPMEAAGAAQDGQVDFMVTFPEAGKYKVFTQFQRNGEVFTTDYVVSVETGQDMHSSMPGMDHSNMGH